MAAGWLELFKMLRNPYRRNTQYEEGHYHFPKPLVLGLTVIRLIITPAGVIDRLIFYPALMVFMLRLTLSEVLEGKIRRGMAPASWTDHAAPYAMRTQCMLSVTLAYYCETHAADFCALVQITKACSLNHYSGLWFIAMWALGNALQDVMRWKAAFQWETLFNAVLFPCASLCLLCRNVNKYW